MNNELCRDLWRITIRRVRQTLIAVGIVAAIMYALGYRMEAKAALVYASEQTLETFFMAMDRGARDSICKLYPIHKKYERIADGEWTILPTNDFWEVMHNFEMTAWCLWHERHKNAE